MTNRAISYRSTRNPDDLCSFREALLQGLAPDGGLFIPSAVPTLPSSIWTSASSFVEVAQQTLALWLKDEVGAETVYALAEDAFTFDVPLVALEGGAYTDVYVLELFHGPTLSFKDFGARTMARLMAHFLAQTTERKTILVATSGDTGSAVADGFAGHDNLDVVLLYPYQKVSPTQERQLIINRPGVQTFAVEGTFDDCQRMVKGAFRDADLTQLNLSSANSINIGRLLPQMLYYIWAVAQGPESLSFCVPSGNLGNLTGGMLAHLSGLPVPRFIAAHNANAFFPRHLAGEDVAFGPTIPTYANAMDVGAPSNFERLQKLLGDQELRAQVWGTYVHDSEILASMRHVYEHTGYLADPHTAVGLHAIRSYRQTTQDHGPMAVLATAHPAKFPEVVERALGRTAETPARLAKLWEAETQVTRIAPTLDALKAHVLA